MTAQARRPRRERRARPPRGLLVGLGVVLLLLVIAIVGWVVWLDRLVVHQFEGRRWTLPAQVYAAPVELYAGLPLGTAEIERELGRLRYRRVATEGGVGTYRVSGSTLTVALRAARFTDETRPAQSLVIECAAGSVSALRDASGHDVPIVRLDPLLIGSIFPTHGEDRIVLAPVDVPPLLPAALKAVEDRNFDTHHGVDPLAMLRALWVDMRARQIEQGGSTLTQQLVKSYFLDSRQTIGRKLREAVMAMALDARFPKADLMNAYINEIFLGQDGERAVHGFGLASQFYFGKPLAELDIAEVALLVAIVRGPSYYDPRRHPERAHARRDLVLKLLADRGVISPAAAEASGRRPLGVTSRPAGAWYPAYLDFVRRTLRRDYREQDLTEAGLRVYTTLDPRAQEQAEGALERELARLDRLHHRKGASLQGAVVVTLPQSGEVIAIVGSRDVGYDGFDHALDAHRPIGSLVKPFIYLSALESGRYSAASVIRDEPIEIRMAGGRTWHPDNFTHQTYGPVTLVRALSESLNLATLGLGLDLGLPKVAATLGRFGLEIKPPLLPAMLLGSIDATPIEVAQLYDGLANGGFRAPLRAVRAVIGNDGKALKAFPLEVTQVSQPEPVYATDRMLEQVMLRGTGRAAHAVLPASLTVAGKSGTSSDYRDSWFAGFSGTHLAVVWVGYDDNQPTGLTGSAGALPVWTQVMAGLKTTPWSAAMPEGLADVGIDWITGERIPDGCPGDVVHVAVPASLALRDKPGCTAHAVDNVLQRAGEWLRDLMPHR